MKRIVLLGQGLLFWELLSSPLAAEVLQVNPHLLTDSCMLCHTKVPTEEEALDGNYFCIKETIDATCEVCHLEYHGGGMNHPSGDADWARRRSSAPETLPLYAGKITCATCHLHSFPAVPTVSLLRKVAIGLGGDMDWTELCRDCHRGY